MKILHGSVRSAVRVHVDDENATPDNPMGHEYVQHFGFYDEHGDATFSIDPDGKLYIYGDPSKPAHHSYGRNTWLWVGDEQNNSVFNCAHDDARPTHVDPRYRTPIGRYEEGIEPEAVEDYTGRRRFVLWRSYDDANREPELFVDWAYMVQPNGTLLITDSIDGSDGTTTRLGHDEWWYVVDLVTRQSATTPLNRDSIMPGYLVDFGRHPGTLDLPWGDVAELNL